MHHCKCFQQPIKLIMVINNQPFTVTWTFLEQKCIPVGCILPASMVIGGWGVCLLVLGVSASGSWGVCLFLVGGSVCLWVRGVCLWVWDVLGCLPLGVYTSQADTPWADTNTGQTPSPLGRHPLPITFWDTHPLPIACWDTTPHPHMDRILDTCLWKHCLPATTVAGGNNF